MKTNDDTNTENTKVKIKDFLKELRDKMKNTDDKKNVVKTN